ncbi:hypothetical protein V6N13_124211 [Hibiscus sabdariffa]|uniref:Uncharacterized protein n=1 Tax=Hibiscus sabdariffa TaxID=183260 RepID=A0ABR2S1B3_9ROSI
MSSLIKSIHGGNNQSGSFTSFQSGKYSEATIETSKALGTMTMMVESIHKADKEIKATFAKAIEDGKRHKEKTLAKKKGAPKVQS